MRNFQARANLQKMAKGDLCFFYHTGDEKAVVGVAEVVREAYPDPTAEEGNWVVVDVKAREPLAAPVSLAAIKAEAKLAEMALVKNARLSVQPVTDAQWKHVCKMGGM